MAFSVAVIACGSGSDQTSTTQLAVVSTEAAVGEVETSAVDNEADSTIEPATTEPASTTEAAVETTDAGEIETAEQFIGALRADELPIGETIVYTAETDPNESLGRPGNYIGKAGWTDTRLADCTEPGWDCGGDVELFDDDDDLNDRYDYLGGFASEPMIGGFYMWKVPGAVIRVGFALTPDQAETYRVVLEGLYPDEVTTFDS